MNSWLYRTVLEENNLNKPIFARQSTLNWMRALQYEIEKEHGVDYKSQFNSCLAYFRSHISRKLEPVSKKLVFKPLFISLTYYLSIESIKNKLKQCVWLQPSTIVLWYYSYYMATRSMFALIGQHVSDNHASVYKAFASSLRRCLPHPLNMIASHSKNEKYEIELPDYKGTGPYDLSKKFPDTREAAQGMLLQYLSGTTKYYVEITKQEILKKGKFANFRTVEARNERDKKLPKHIGFMHCAFRYRGKANYRDGIYLTYKGKQNEADKQFFEGLAATSRFIFVCALALAFKSSMKDETKDFIKDINQNLKGIEDIAGEKRIWLVMQ